MSTTDHTRKLLQAALDSQAAVANWRYSKWGPKFPEVMAENRARWSSWKMHKESITDPDPWTAKLLKLYGQYMANATGSLPALQEHLRSNP